MSNIIDSIRMSGTTYAISDSGGTKVVEITQSDYDNLPTSAKTANIMYVITDAEPFDVSNYYTKAETSGATELATAFAATQPKLSAGTNITIDANNVISAEGGGGKAVVGGRGITVTTGATADTVSFSLPISAGTGSNSVIEGDYANKATGSYSHAEGGTTSATTNYAHAEGMKTKAAGQSSHAEGERTTATTHYSHTEGYFTIANNKSEHASGQYNVSNKTDTTFGHSGNTLFSVGNGTDTTARHNAFEIRQNGDIYITKDGSDVKLQDQLGGGGGGIDSGTVQTMIDQSISGKTNQTDFVSHSGNTSIHVTTAQTAAWDAKSDFSGSYNDLTDKPTIPIVPTNVSSFNNDAGYITSNDISGKTNQSDFVSHSGNTTMHVTASEKSTWNAKSDFSGNYNDLSNKPTIPSKTSDLTNDSNFATTGDVQTATADMATKTWVGNQGYLTEHQSLSNYYKKSETSGATQISTALASKADTATTYTKTDVDNALASKQSTLESGTNIKTINNESILGSGNIDIQGGGKAVSGGTNISITTGETADTINCTLPIYSGINLDGTAAGAESIRFSTETSFGSSKGLRSIRGRYNSNALGEDSICFGINSYVRGAVSFGVGRDLDSYGNYATIFGYGTNTKNLFETAIGKYNTSNSGSTEADNTLFSVGNGTNLSNRHNAFEIRQNGDIYLTLDGQDVKLQDQLGGGGSSYTAGDGIDITNDVISVTGKVDTSAFTAHTADTTIHVTSTEKATWNAKSDFSGSYNDLTNKPTIPTSASQLTNDSGYITSSALDGYATTATTSVLNNTLTAHTADTTIHVTSSDKSSWNGAATNASNAITALGGLSLVKLTQAEYDALATKDNSTLYVIVN